MKQINVIKSVLAIEAAGFLITAISIWINEFLDLPHYFFGFPPIEISIADAVFESVFVISFGLIVMFFTWRLEKRIAQLEKLLPICSFCKKIRKPDSDPETQDSWLRLEQYIGDRTGSQFSHGLCPECAKKHYGEYLK